MFDRRFPVLVASIRERFHPDAVFVFPPYVWIILEKGANAWRFWMPATLKGDVTDPEITLHAVPENARFERPATGTPEP